MDCLGLNDGKRLLCGCGLGTARTAVVYDAPFLVEAPVAEARHLRRKAAAAVDVRGDEHLCIMLEKQGDAIVVA